MLLSLFVVVAAFAASEASICTTVADCGVNQCCYIKPEFMVVSKRQLVLPKQPASHKTGVCENYHSLADQCDTFETLNGHCGCGTGMLCDWVPDPITSPVSRRKPIWHSEPGAYRCVKK